MRFYLDENLSPALARLARDRGLDAVSAHEVGHRGEIDAVLLRYAALEGRRMVTQNYRDFALVTVEFRERREHHAGVVFVPQRLADGPAATLARALERYANAHPRGLLAYLVDWLTPMGEGP